MTLESMTTNNQHPDDLPPLPELPEWSKMDNLGNLVPSQVRSALVEYALAYGHLVQQAERAKSSPEVNELIAALADIFAMMAEGYLIRNPVKETEVAERLTAVRATLDKTSIAQMQWRNAPDPQVKTPWKRFLIASQPGNWTQLGDCFDALGLRRPQTGELVSRIIKELLDEIWLLRKAKAEDDKQVKRLWFGLLDADPAETTYADEYENHQRDNP